MGDGFFSCILFKDCDLDARTTALPVDIFRSKSRCSLAAFAASRAESGVSSVAWAFLSLPPRPPPLPVFAIPPRPRAEASITRSPSRSVRSAERCFGIPPRDGPTVLAFLFATMMAAVESRQARSRKGPKAQGMCSRARVSAAVV